MTLLIRWWRVHFLLAELCLAVALATLFALWASRFGGAGVVATTLKGNRAAIYGALASIFGSLLGFTLAAVSIVLGYAAEGRLGLLRDSKHYATLWRVFVSSMRALAAASVAALVGLIVDRDAAPVPLILYVCVGTTALAIFRIARCLWVFEQVIELVTATSKSQRDPLP
jgi:hypothetical protein